MKVSILNLVLFLFVVGSAHATKVNCKLVSKNGKQTISATIPARESDDAVFSNHSIEFGEYSVDFSLSVYKQNGQLFLDAMFTENAVVQDELTSFQCKIPNVKNKKYIRAKVFCEEQITIDQNRVGTFSCSI